MSDPGDDPLFRGQPNGLAPLDKTGLIPSQFLSNVPNRQSTYSVGTRNADFITNGINDDVIIQSAVDAVGANGVLFIQPGTYILSNTVNINYSNFVLQGSGAGITMFMPSSSFSASNNALITLNNQTSGTTLNLSNVVVQDMTFNANNSPTVHGIKIRGGDYVDGDSTTKVRVRRSTFMNVHNTAVGHITIFSGRGSTDRGPVTDVIIEDCELLDTSRYHMYFTGGQIEDIKILKCRFRNSQYGCIGFNQQNKDDSSVAAGSRSNKNWEVAHCKFIDNHLSNVSLGAFVADFTDSNKTGVRGLKWHHNWHEGQNSTIEQYALSIQSCWDVQIHNNTFWKIRSAFNVGQSNNGPWYENDGTQMMSIKDNKFFCCYNIVDHDSDFFAEWAGNDFNEITYAGIGGYSRQWPSKFHDNHFYNTPTDNTVPSQNKAAFSCIGNGVEIYNNTVVDDRLLSNPTTAPTLTTVTGGSQGSRTYYAKYSWVNDTGVTLASAESTIVVAANKLLVVTHPDTSTYGPPTGAKLVNIYVGTSSGNETLQASVPTAWQQETQTVRTNTFGPVNWTEPTTGLIAGSALPVSNTTSAITLYGIYEISGGGGPLYPNVYKDNHFWGITTEISKQPAYKRVQKSNFTNRTFSTTGEQLLEAIPYAQGNLTGATTFDVGNGEFIIGTLTGNITTTISNGHYVGQRLRLLLAQDATGSRTISKPSNVKLAGSAFSPTAAANAVDEWIVEWDGVNWYEISRSLNIG